MAEQPRATVREIDGQLVLDDPDALAVARAVAKHNCRATLEEQRERVEHFVRRVAALGRTPAEVVITLVNVDDPHGRPLAELLMPGNEAAWQAFRDAGQVPFARGLATREGIQSFLDIVDEDAADKLRALDGLAVVVVDCGVAEVFEAAQPSETR